MFRANLVVCIDVVEFRTICMEATRNVIEEIKRDAASLQRKFLTLPTAGETISKEQQKAIDRARTGLQGWRGWELGELVNAFSEKS